MLIVDLLLDYINNPFICEDVANEWGTRNETNPCDLCDGCENCPYQDEFNELNKLLEKFKFDKLEEIAQCKS